LPRAIVVEFVNVARCLRSGKDITRSEAAETERAGNIDFANAPEAIGNGAPKAATLPPVKSVWYN
jgi:hypothetical protein